MFFSYYPNTARLITTVHNQKKKNGIQVKCCSLIIWYTILDIVFQWLFDHRFLCWFISSDHDHNDHSDINSEEFSRQLKLILMWVICVKIKRVGLMIFNMMLNHIFGNNYNNCQAFLWTTRGTSMDVKMSHPQDTTTAGSCNNSHRHHPNDH